MTNDRAPTRPRWTPRTLLVIALGVGAACGDVGADPAGQLVAPYVGAVSDCPDATRPGCRRIVDCPEPADLPRPGADGLTTGALPAASFCQPGTAAGGLTPTCTPGPGQVYLRGTSSQPWLDACAATGRTVVLAGSDDGVASLALPFPFTFYGEPRSSVGVGANGTLAFGAPTVLWLNQPLPYHGAADTVLPFWDDLVMRAGVCAATFGAAPDRQYVLQWEDAALYADTSAHLTFEVVLSETTHTIDVRYRTLRGDRARASGGSATVGIQRGLGASYDQVAYATEGAVAEGRVIRWTPTGGTACARGTWSRTYEGSCASHGSSYLPIWSRLRYAGRVPPGASIAFEVRAADTLAALDAAPVVRLPDAPQGDFAAASGGDLGAILRARAAGLEDGRYLRVDAVLQAAAGGAAPVLSGAEVQFHCIPNEYAYDCREGTPCKPDAACRLGAIGCDRTRPYCADAGPAPPGTPCGVNMACTSAGACAPCAAGAPCVSGEGCATGTVSCATGTPVCVPTALAPAGVGCGGEIDGYVRTAAPFEWLDACRAPGGRTMLVDADDATVQEPLPFTFPYFGTPYTRVGISTNGMVSFDRASNAWTHVPLPAQNVPNTVFAFWDDLVARDGICVATFGAAPRRRFVVQWNNARFYEDRGESEHLDFEVVLSETTHTIDVLYARVDGFGDRAQGSNATVGIQRGATGRYDQVSYNQADAVHRDQGFRWTPTVTARCDGAGVCARSTCVGGGLPSAEVCDGLDNDCDGAVDESCTPCLTGTVPGVTMASPWQMHRVRGPFCWPRTFSTHGEVGEYEYASVPPATDGGWRAVAADTIDFSEVSALCGRSCACLDGGEFTYFQTFFEVPPSYSVTDLSLTMTRVDDGARVTVYNDRYPDGVVDPGSYVYLAGTGTSTNLARFLAPGRNRVVITHVDDCCSERYLTGVRVNVNGRSLEACLR